MKILRFALAPLLALSLAAPAFAEKIPLGELSRYINSLQTVESDFTQVNADGTIATGKMYMRRPGRVRFEYAPPDRTLVMAGEGQVAIFDPKSNQSPEQYPLSRTPLKLILANNVDLSQARMVVAHGEDGNSTFVTAQDPEHPEYGTIQMVFTAAPTELRQWVITDDAGGKTTVILGDLNKGVSLNASLFSLQSEIAKRN
ncbi:outer membrane lipoprotein carrier protein LolA [Albirhodobacter sp. R86504]|jgi:outer membrane lipoprotein-sorting protein|uniref:LolA family protein n=1 Tax=Albirhodobacter sp. R86504 TaxID=3093848 RepID=UPI00366F926E